MNKPGVNEQALQAPKRLFVKTWGCQMNVYDSARMADVVAPLGYVSGETVEDADLVIFNTCHIREKATEKLFSELGRLKPQRDARASSGERMLVAVAGCVAQAEGEEIQRRMPWVDMVFGPQAYHQLPEMIARVTREAGRVLNTDFPAEAKFDHLPEESRPPGVTAFLSVQEGCDKFCSFCVVPYTRGAEYQRPLASIYAEAARLVQAGAREITLLGQNVNAWHGVDDSGQAVGLGGLIRALSSLPGLLRIRYTTSHPRDMDADLIAAHGAVPSLMPFLHLPVQSGSDAILQAMNRKHSADEYRRTIDRLRAARPDLALSSDFIVGFPGETDADFRATIKLVEDVGFAQAFSFAYSRRPGTPAAAMPNQIEDRVKDERLAELQTLLRSQQTAFNATFQGRTTRVLFETPSDREEGFLFGRSAHGQAVRAKAPARLIGQEVEVRVTVTAPNSLTGEIVTR